MPQADVDGRGGAFSLDQLDEAAFADIVAPLFERAPRFIERLAAHRPFGSWPALLDRALPLALEMPRDAQLELIDAHPRIGAPPGSVSAHSYVEQGYDRESAAAGAEAERVRVAAELQQLNRSYEEHFGFRFVVFVAGRTRAQIVPLLRASLGAEVDAERERAIRDVVAIARDRATRSRLTAGPHADADPASVSSPSAAATAREEARP